MKVVPMRVFPLLLMYRLHLFCGTLLKSKRERWCGRSNGSITRTKRTRRKKKRKRKKCEGCLRQMHLVDAVTLYRTQRRVWPELLLPPLPPSRMPRRGKREKYRLCWSLQTEKTEKITRMEFDLHSLFLPPHTAHHWNQLPSTPSKRSKTNHKKKKKRKRTWSTMV